MSMSMSMPSKFNGVEGSLDVRLAPWNKLWVGNLSPETTESDLMQLFSKYGSLDSVDMYSSRSFAYLLFKRVEDATAAKDALQGIHLHGMAIKIEFARPKPAKHGSLFAWNTGFSDTHLPHPHTLTGRKDGEPSNILWVGYPPSVQVDEQMLHNSMILFGEIERITNFPAKNYSFVEFRSLDEARRAKEGLQGRLFNDPRIVIRYSNSELTPLKAFPGSYPGMRGPTIPFTHHPFRPIPQMGVPDPNLPPIRPNNFPGPWQTSGAVGQYMTIPQMGVPGPNHPILPNNFSGPLQTMPMRPLGAFDLHSGPKDFQANPNPLEPNWRMLSPPPGMHTSPAPCIRQPMMPGSGSLGFYDASHFQRDPKCSRLDSSLSMDNATFPPNNIDESGLGLEQSYGPSSVTGGGASGGAFSNVEGRNHVSELGTRLSDAGHGDSECIWRGVIAKGGTPICHARCVPIGKGIGTKLPEVVNCSLKRGLDKLKNRYPEVIGVDIVFFLPEGEDDLDSYTEFIRYLSSRDLAGVAKFDDGTTLCLVPPSDFINKVLNFEGPQQLYGVALKFPEQPQNQPNQVQSVVSGGGEGSSEDEVVKNQRYQYTLQFAANLLTQLQNQQQQQQTNTPAGEGTGNQL